ncbi:hypothetical protein [Halomarina oriensis]|uniref:Uncharacterized protein n=1 Tax=Halomarina oriensis TaxID=671145 RepID=A0A6B0GGV4_9EURY|nr:hypothetical protein [Halomarina oriensis]MWG33187.1 hypothetical protein [Halomarina oriensis]
MAASDPDTDVRVADHPRIDLEACQTEDGDILLYDPTPGHDTADAGRWIRADPDGCVDLNESH